MYKKIMYYDNMTMTVFVNTKTVIVNSLIRKQIIAGHSISNRILKN